MEEKDYSHLEGKVIEMVFSNSPSYSVVVVGVERDIGITIVLKEDNKTEIACFDGPSTKIWKRDVERGAHELYHERYDEIFAAAVSMIEEGVFISETVTSMFVHEDTMFNSLQPCSFN